MSLLHAVTLAAVGIDLTLCAAIAAPKPDDLGLLVGLSSGRTLWIAPQDGSLRLVSTKESLLVPRPDGFWWVGTARRCRATAYDGSGMGITEAGDFLNRNEAVFVARAGDTARVSLDGTDCDVAEREVMAKRAAAARAYADSLARAGDSTALHGLASQSGNSNSDTVSEDLECEVETREITFVSASAISVEQRDTQTEFCSPAKYYTSGRNVVMRFGSDDRIALRPLLSPPNRARVTKQFSSFGGCGFDEEMNEDHLDDAWSVRRTDGAWRATFYVDGPIVCRGGTEMELTVPLPSTFTNESPLPITWKEIKRRIPGVVDAASDRSRTHLAIIAHDTLSIVRVRDGRLAETLAKVPVWPGEHFVMLRWATPGEITNWNRLIPNLREPVIVATPRAD